MYSFKNIDGIAYVIHDESGTTLPFHGGKKQAIPDYKYEYFKKWVSYSRTYKKQLRNDYLNSLYASSTTNRTGFVQDIIKAKKALEMANVPMTYVPIKYWVDDPLVPLQTSEPCTSQKLGYKEMAPITEQKETTMSETDLVLEQKRYLKDRLWTLNNEKENALDKQYGLRDDATPNTANELVARITSGKYVIETTSDGNLYSYNPTENIRWRDPSLKKDFVGHRAASEKLVKAWQNAKDLITIKSADEGLAALQAFEATTIQ